MEQDQPMKGDVTMPRKINRIALKYRSFGGIVDDADGLGFYDYQVSANGLPFRQPKPGEDVFSARAWLRSAGFIQRDRQITRAGRGLVLAPEYTEVWLLRLPRKEPATAATVASSETETGAPVKTHSTLKAYAWQTHPDGDPEIADFHDPALDAW
jgi:hypothetical protein